jgi:hypothetical protein
MTADPPVMEDTVGVSSIAGAEGDAVVLVESSADHELASRALDGTTVAPLSVAYAWSANVNEMVSAGSLLISREVAI